MIYKLLLILGILLTAVIGQAQFQKVPADQVSVINTNFVNITGTNAQSVFESIDGALSGVSGLNTNTSYRYAGGTTQYFDSAFANYIFLGGVLRTNWPSGGTSDVSTWSGYPATQTVDIAGNEITNVTAITLGGERKTSWPIVGPGTLVIMETGVSSVTSVLYHVTSDGHTNRIGTFYSSP